jgi:hypothetical protein
VRAAVVDEVYFDEGLAYDTVRGATAYVGYTSGFNGAVFDLTGFVHRRRGDIVNCTDCAAIVGTYAGMLGVELDYAIILQNFALNYILAIGGDTFSPCPFGTYGCGFSYHAVTTPDDAATIYDATLQLDGDDDPSTAPNTPLEVLGVPGDEYLDRLVMSGSARYDYIQPGSFR